jgi:Zn-dependent peptidase ImmA (M78 family)
MNQEDANRIFVRNDLGPADVQHVVAHEYSHLLCRLHGFTPQQFNCSDEEELAEAFARSLCTSEGNRACGLCRGR